MSDGKKIEFTYGNAKARFNPETHKLEFEGDDDSKLRNGIIGIFNAIKKIGGDPKKIDQGLETTLLNNLQSIFDAGKTAAIDDDEMDWALGFQRGDKVDEFIEAQYKKVTDGQSPEGIVNDDEQSPEGVVKNEEQQPSVTPDGEITLTDGLPFDSYIREKGADISKYIPLIEDENDEGTLLISNVVIYGADVKIGDNTIQVYANTLEEVKALRDEINSELAKIKNIPESETNEDKIARCKENLRVIEKVAALSNYDKQTLAVIFKKYCNDPYITEGYFDVESPEFNSFVQKLINTKDATVITNLGLLVFNQPDENFKERRFRGNETTYRNLVSLYKEIRDKEQRGESLSNNEKSLKYYFMAHEIGYGYIYPKDADFNQKSDLRIVYDGNGVICYQGESHILEKNGLALISHMIGGKSKELVENFQKDLKAAEMAVEEAFEDEREASEDEKKVVRKEQYKALVHKYASVKDDSFACSVFTSHLLEYADPADISTIINTNGAEYLTYLELAIEPATEADYYYHFDDFDDFSDEKKNEMRKAMVDRAVGIYTRAEKGNVANMRYLTGIKKIINNTTFSEDETENITIRNKKMSQILESYFDIKSDGKGDKIYTYKGRKMTYEEVSELFKSSENDSHIISSVFRAFGNDPDTRQVIVMNINDDLGKSSGIDYDGRISLLNGYIVENDDGTYSVDDLPDGLEVAHLINTLPMNDVNSDSEQMLLFDTLLNKLSFDANIDVWKALRNKLTDGDNAGSSKEYFTNKFVDKLTNELSFVDKSTNELIEKKLDKAKAICKALEIDQSELVSAMKAYESKLIDALNKDRSLSVKDVIRQFDKYGLDKTELLKRVNVNKAEPNKDMRKECQNVIFQSFLNGAKLNEDVSIDKLIENGWVEKISQLTSFKKNKTNAWGADLYRIGGFQFEIYEGAYYQRSQKGTQAGLDLYASLKGANSPWGWGHEKAKDILGKIDKNSVVDTISTFNGFGEDSIMQFLEDEWFNIKVEDMLKIPRALVEWGKENDFDTSELEGLINQSQDRLQKGSFEKGVAKQIDDAMKNLINLHYSNR